MKTQTAALCKFGNVSRVKAETWEVWSVVWLEQRNEHVDVEQKRHANIVSISLTSCDVMMPLVVRITGKPSSAVAIVKRSAVVASGTTTNTLVSSGRRTVSGSLI